MPKPPPDGAAQAARRARVAGQFLRSARAELDPVESWKEEALARVVGVAAAPARSSIEVGASPIFFLLCLVSGVPFGPLGPLAVVLGLSSVVLAQSLPGALLARARGVSSVVRVMPGAFAETAGVKANGSSALVHGLLGSVANLTLAALLDALAQRIQVGTLGAGLHTLALWHGVWGLAQSLPLLPFRVGTALAARLRPQFALIFGGFSANVALPAALVAARVVPALFPVAMLALLGAATGFVRAVREAMDERDGVARDADRAEALVAHGEPLQATTLARGALGRARGERLRARLWKTLAWAAIGSGDGLLAHAALGALSPRELDVHLVGSYLSSCNRTDEALELLERARTAGQRTRETTKLLLDLLLRGGDLVRARRVALEDFGLLSADEAALVEQSVLAPAAASAREGIIA